MKYTRIAIVLAAVALAALGVLDVIAPSYVGIGLLALIAINAVASLVFGVRPAERNAERISRDAQAAYTRESQEGGEER